jgi:AcrR family transcriptional regulator
MDDEKLTRRKYQLKKRADDVAETRRRITEAAVELHGTIGPARTTLSEVARRAGVQRHTVYRHFPSDAELLGACSAHYFTANPWPDLEAWRTIAEPRQRLARALDELYAYYERTEPMYRNVLRDAEVVDGVRAALVPMQAFLDDAVTVLAEGWGTSGRRRRVLHAALRHAVDFLTWRSLAADGRIARKQAVALVSALVDAAGSPL